MTPNNFIKELEDKGLLTGEGFALDLGCGEGRDSFYLVQKGYKVTSVDYNKESIEILKENTEKLPEHIIISDITEFDIPESKYAFIIANNVLPFINDKNKVKEVILHMVKGLAHEGKIYFTLFGNYDEWSNNKSSMSFWTYDETHNLLEDLGLKIINRTTEERYGPTMKGTIKYWHIHKFLYEKI